jgi:hypothetical protein
MSINTLKSMVANAGGLAKPNKFHVELPSIPGSPITTRDLSILCRTASLPSKQVATHERRIGMETEKIAYGYVVDDVNISFLVLNDYRVKRYFDAWRALTINETAQTANYKDEYKRSVKIHQLAVATPSLTASLGVQAGPISKSVSRSFAPFPQIQIQKPVYSVELLEAFPITTTATEFVQEPDGFLEMSVQFAYTNWREIESSQQTINIDLPGGFQFEATN